ncbi:MAG: hypothetical protein NTY38_06975 [Acidobacteria bacterium]|nr:hypothetical protein [Acidobacteriota bacterium]
MRRLSLSLIAILSLPLLAQVGGPYPDPGRSPGSRYPGQQSPTSGIPWPKRKKKGGDGKEPTTQERLKTSTGKIRIVNDKTITIDTDDGRVMEFKRTDKTKVFEKEKELKVADLHPGDVVSLDATEDDEGYFYARDIRVVGHAPPPRAEASAENKETAPERPAGPSAMTLPPVIGDTEGNEKPKLQRGAHPRPRRQEQETVELAQTQVQVQAIPPLAPGAASATATAVAVGGNSAEDPIITKAREASETFTDKLPNYVCTQFMTRYQSEGRPVDWRPLDVVSAEVVYHGGKEDYRNVAINGKQTKKAITEIGGSWSTGEFATTLVDVLSRSSNAAFFFRRQTMVTGISARVYDFRVEKANSHWHIQVAGQWIQPAYKGSLWVEPKTGRVLRIEMQTAFLPDEFPLDQVESAVDYEAVRLGSNKYLLPVHAENLSCQRFSRACSRANIDFRNYHVFGADTNIKFEDAAK